ncbi:MAG TPA: ribonuclease D [Chitinophagales bacterium]|nr:ribonuclease D [Chitinophagales bacterium]
MGNEIVIEYINTSAALDKCVSELEQAPELAFDLEFDKNNYAYGFNLCLIQIATRDRCYIIDPMAQLKLEPLFRILEKPEVLKVVHSPGEDLRLLHSLRCYPKNLFDTQVVIRLLNHEKISLGDALENVLGITADKKLQRSNWMKRPLTDEQIKYAANDVLHLLPMHDALQQQAEAKGIVNFIEEELKFLETTIHEDGDKENFLKESELTSMSDYHQYVLNGLLKVRDTAAQRINKPPSWVAPNDKIRDVVYGKEQLSSFLDWPGLHPAVRTPKFKSELIKTYSELTEAAKDLSKKSKTVFLTAAQRHEKAQQKEESEKLREVIFKPIQQELERLYGEHAAKYILGDGVVGRLLRKEMQLREIKENYRREVIMKTAAALNIDISAYL